MSWRWVWLWGILYNLILHFIYFQWGKLPGDRDALYAWWNSFWGEVVHRLDDLRSWAQGKINEALGYAWGLYLLVRDWVNGLVNDLRNWTQGKINEALGYAWGLYLLVRDWVNGLVNDLRSWASSQINAAQAWLMGWVQAIVAGLHALWDWITPYRELISNWLVSVRGTVDWLRWQAMAQLQAFLANPVGYVLGWLLTPVCNIVNWWMAHGQALVDFVRDDLVRLRNLLSAGYVLLRRFVDRPGETILELIWPLFLDWLEDLLAENW